MLNNVHRPLDKRAQIFNVDAMISFFIFVLLLSAFVFMFFEYQKQLELSQFQVEVDAHYEMFTHSLLFSPSIYTSYNNTTIITRGLDSQYGVITYAYLTQFVSDYTGNESQLLETIFLEPGIYFSLQTHIFNVSSGLFMYDDSVSITYGNSSDAQIVLTKPHFVTLQYANQSRSIARINIGVGYEKP